MSNPSPMKSMRCNLIRPKECVVWYKSFYICLISRRGSFIEYRKTYILPQSKDIISTKYVMWRLVDHYDSSEMIEEHSWLVYVHYIRLLLLSANFFFEGFPPSYDPYWLIVSPLWLVSCPIVRRKDRNKSVPEFYHYVYYCLIFSDCHQTRNLIFLET